jgi:hypothetical protein
MTITSIGHSGAIKTSNYGLSGHIDAHNVSLHPNWSGGSIARLFGVQDAFIGKLVGQRMTLSHNNATSVLNKESALQYNKDLDQLHTIGQHITLMWKANKAIAAAYSTTQRVNTSLHNYITWGQTRINRVSIVRNWYSNHIAYYNKCLNYITPLAAEHVPSWRWQECALKIELNKYSRDAQVNGIENLSAMNRNGVPRIYARIANSKAQYVYAIHLLRLSCQYRGKQRNACITEVAQARATDFDSGLNYTMYSEFKSIVPKVKTALKVDSGIETHGERRLSGIAKNVARIYKRAY